MTSFFRRSRLAMLASGLALLSTAVLSAQTPEPDAKPAQAADSKPTPAASRPARAFDNPFPADWTVKTYYLHHVTQQNDANEILVALRNTVLPSVHVFLVDSENAIVLYGPADQHQLATSLIHDLDRPKQSYRLTYTLSETDAGKRVGTQHYSLLAVTGQRTTSKEGSKVPVLTGSYSSGGNASAQQQFQYIDVGLNIDATLEAYAGGVRLRSKLEQSSTTEDKSISGISEPIIRQAVLEGTGILVPGTPVSLGSLDVPGTTRRIDVEVVAELLP